MLVYLQIIDADDGKDKFAEIYEAYRELAYRVAFEHLNHESDAEDVVQHVFMKIAENINGVEPVSAKTKSLIVMMVKNRITDVLRVRSRQPKTVYLDQLHGRSCEAESGGSFLKECILQLSEKQRTVIWLKYFYGYDLHEIAKMLDISLSSAQKIDQRAKLKLKELYAEGREERV